MAIAAYKAALLGVAIVIGVYFSDSRPPPLSRDFAGSTLGRRFSAWDGTHYLRLSQVGYEAGSPSCAFYPLYPFLIRVVSDLTFTKPWVAGLLISNGLGIVSAWLFYRFVKSKWSAEVARDSLLLLLAFPGALFFSLIYTESLFLTLCILFFIMLYRGRYGWAAAFAFLLPLTKAIGIFVMFPLVWRLFTTKASWKSYCACYAPVLGYLAYLLIMYSQTGNPFEGFDAQKNYPNQPSVTHLLDLPGLLKACGKITHWHHYTGSALDRFLFGVFIFSALLMVRTDGTLFCWLFIAGLVPAMATWFVSYSRNIMMCFPIFIALGMLFGKAHRRLSFGFCLSMLWGIQWVLLYRFLNFKWAG